MPKNTNHYEPDPPRPGMARLTICVAPGGIPLEELDSLIERRRCGDEAARQRLNDEVGHAWLEFRGDRWIKPDYYGLWAEKDVRLPPAVGKAGVCVGRELLGGNKFADRPDVVRHTCWLVGGQEDILHEAIAERSDRTFGRFYNCATFAAEVFRLVTGLELRVTTEAGHHKAAALAQEVRALNEKTIDAERPSEAKERLKERIRQLQEEVQKRMERTNERS